jgi:hypothetical protein
MDAIVLNPKDNVAVVLREVAPRESLQIAEGGVAALDWIPYGHKIARHDIPQGELILKYGMPVGRAKSDIPRGGHVHMHNVVSVYMDNLQEHYE